MGWELAYWGGRGRPRVSYGQGMGLDSPSQGDTSGESFHGLPHNQPERAIRPCGKDRRSEDFINRGSPEEVG